MSSYSLDFLKIELYRYRACESAFKSPVDLEPLQSLILQKEREDSGSSSGSTGVAQQYTDFLLPLPEHLQQTEVGLPDPAMVAQRRKESGLDKPMNNNTKDAKNELKARAELKNRLKAAPRPEMQRKFKIAPRPGGFTQHNDGE